MRVRPRPVVADAQKEEREARDAEQLAKAKKLTPMQAFTGGVTGLGIAFVLYGFTQTVAGAFDGRPDPGVVPGAADHHHRAHHRQRPGVPRDVRVRRERHGAVALAAQKWLDKLTGVDLIDEQAAAWEEERKARDEEKK